MINSARWLLKWIKQIFNLKLIKLSGVYKNVTKRAFVTHVLIKKLLLVKLNKKYSSFLWNFISIILVHKIRILFMHDTQNMEIFQLPSFVSTMCIQHYFIYVKNVSCIIIWWWWWWFLLQAKLFKLKSSPFPWGRRRRCWWWWRELKSLVFKKQFACTHY